MLRGRSSAGRTPRDGGFPGRSKSRPAPGDRPLLGLGPAEPPCPGRDTFPASRVTAPRRAGCRTSSDPAATVKTRIVLQGPLHVATVALNSQRRSTIRGGTKGARLKLSMILRWMPRRPRIHLAAVPVHIVQRGHHRNACFFVEDDYVACRHWPGEALKASDCSLHAYVLITDPVHLLLTPPDPGAVPRLMIALGRRYVR